MKLFYAKFHVGLGNYVARPGEVFEADLPEDEIERLLKLGAIAECEVPPDMEEALQESEPVNEPESDQQQENGTETEPEEEMQEAEPDDSEPVEIGADIADIDVMDGISAPAKKSGRKGGKSR